MAKNTPFRERKMRQMENLDRQLHSGPDDEQLELSKKEKTAIRKILEENKFANSKPDAKKIGGEEQDINQRKKALEMIKKFRQSEIKNRDSTAPSQNTKQEESVKPDEFETFDNKIEPTRTRQSDAKIYNSKRKIRSQKHYRPQGKPDYSQARNIKQEQARMYKDFFNQDKDQVD